MHIVFDSVLPELGDKYMLLELDTFQDPITARRSTAWCLVENIPLAELPIAAELRGVHESMMQHYRDQHWDRCEITAQGLMGRWGGAVDSFYENLLQRIQQLRDQELGDGWDGSLPKFLDSNDGA